MTVLDGKTIAEEENEKIKKETAAFGRTVSLAVILVGDDPASQSYVASKEKACQEVGMSSLVIKMPAGTDEKTVIKKIRELNDDRLINGILVQIPLPDHLDENRVIEAIDPRKDVDCLHPYNFGKLFSGCFVVEPCTPKGIMKMLDHFKIDVYGKNAVVIGRSNIVGKPIAMMLMQKNATVTICHSKTNNLADITRSADILVAAIGKPNFVKDYMVKNGAVVIDVGINRVDDPNGKRGYKLVGDVDYESVSKVASALTPVPGGVGKMTIPMLLENTLQLARLQNETVE
jgi:methylenetetrahydrofolate dehydrogenase (NADP+) / methenyltetrahydrofolate cyclohydrolase